MSDTSSEELPIDPNIEGKNYQIRDIVNVAKKWPLLAFVYVLLIALFILVGTVSYLYITKESGLENVRSTCQTNIDTLNNKIDFLNSEIRIKDDKHTEEMVSLMEKNNQELRDRITKQEETNNKIDDIIITNEKIIKKLKK